MILWMAYAALTSTLVAGAGWAAEQLAEAAGIPRRFVWLVAICVAVGVPMVGRPASGVIDLGNDHVPGASEAAPILVTPPPPQSAWWDGAALQTWTAASAVGLGLIALVLGRVHMARRRWRKERMGHTEVYVSERFGPALVGVVRPAIVVPTWVSRMEARARAIIVGHEEEHRRAGDQLTLLLGGIATALFPWNPAMWWMSRRLRAAVEIDCDGRLLAKGVRPADYGEVLLDVGARPRTSWGPIPALIEPKSLLERRLRTMGNGRRKMSARGRAVFTALAVLLLATACETPAPTGVRNAMDRAIGAQRAGAQEVDTPTVRLGNLTFEGDTLIVDDIRIVVPGKEPLIFVNDELINPEGQDGAVLKSLDPGDIERVEVIKGARARESFGPRGVASGVIQIYMKGYDPPQRPPSTDRTSERALEERARELAIRTSEAEQAVRQEYEAVRERLRASERELAAEIEASQRHLRTEREQVAEEMEARALVEEAALTEATRELRLREQALLERARERAAERQRRRQWSLETSAALEARIQALTKQLQELERGLEGRSEIRRDPPGDSPPPSP